MHRCPPRHHPALEQTPAPIGGASPRHFAGRVIRSAYHETARRALAREATDSNTSAEWIAAAERVLGRLRDQLVRWFGPDGFNAVLARALATARADHPALGHVRIAQRREAFLVEVAPSAHRFRPAELGDALVALIAATLALLSRLIGDDLVSRLLHQAWPEEAPNDVRADARPADTRMTERE